MKLEKEVNDSSLSGTVNTYYAGNYIYKKGNSHGQSDVALTFFNSEEGYVEPVFEQVTVNSSFGSYTTTRLTGFEYTYQYKDHLGNIRLAYQDMNGDGVISAETEIKEENHYYPFGLKHKGYNSQIVGRDHNYGYNGIEESNELGNNMLEMDMRQYDPAIARWIVIDPITHYEYSPYQAFDNNPIFWADPSGADSENDNQSDIFGRNKFDSFGMYIAPNERGEKNNNYSSPGPKGKRKTNKQNSIRIFKEGDCECSYLNDVGITITESANGLADFRDMSLESLTGFEEAKIFFEDGYDVIVNMDFIRENQANLEIVRIISLGMFALGAGQSGMMWGANIGNLQITNRSYSFQGGLAPKTTSTNTKNVALGLNNGLYDFAKSNGFLTYRDFNTGASISKLKQMISNPNHRLHFNLDGMSRLQYRRFNPNAPVSHRNITNWELHTILNNPKVLSRTTFYRNGSPVGVPGF